jgi:hypothetical protein
MKANIKRIAALESRQLGQPTPFCIHHRDGESFEDAAARQGITTGRYLSIAKPMGIEEWCEVARVQQQQLFQGNQNETL